MALLVLSGGPAIAAARTATMVPVAGQQMVYEAGTGWAISSGAIEVAVSIELIDKKTAWLVIALTNGGEQPFTITESQVSARIGTQVVAVLSYDDLIRAERRRKMWEGIAVGLAAGANSYNAAQQGRYTQSGTVSGSYNAHGAGGSTRGNYQGTYSGSGYDATAAQLAQQNANAQNQAMIGQLRDSQVQRGATLEQLVLRSQTISPGSNYLGRLQLKLPRKAKTTSILDVTINLGNETRPFAIALDGQPNGPQIASLGQKYPAPIAAVFTESEDGTTHIILIHRTDQEADAPRHQASIEAGPKTPGVLGISFQPGRAGRWLVVAAIADYSRASQAGITVGDQLISLDTVLVSSAAGVQAVLARHSAGDTISASFRREGKDISVSVELVGLPLVSL